MSRRPDALTVPTTALGSDGDGNFVYAITGNRITRLAVKTGLTDNGRVEVTAGLSEETPVVASTKNAPPLRTAVQPQMARENSSHTARKSHAKSLSFMHDSPVCWRTLSP